MHEEQHQKEHHPIECHGHGDDCSCPHSHNIELTAKEKPFKSKALLNPLLGILGIIIGLLLHRFGYSDHYIAYLAAAAVAGYPVAKAGLRALLSGAGADINLLTAIAGVGAMALGDFAEGAAVLTLFSIGEYLESAASERTRRSISEVMDLSPMMARIKRDNSVNEINAEHVFPGDIILVLPGEKIPVDGEIIKGESSINQAPITGESVPVDKNPGNTVFAGSLNGEGPLEILVTKRSKDTTIARIIAMVEESQSSKAKSQRMVDTFARYWTPLMLGLALAVSIAVPLVFKQSFRPWIYRGLTVLIVSCPCSLVISTPVTVVAAIARAAKNGVLIKGGVFLEELGRIKAVAFDKTGTITEGRLAVEQVLTVGENPEYIISVAAAVEVNSEHPLAKAIVNEANSRELYFEQSEDFVSLRGKGTYGSVEGQRILVGSPGLFGMWQVGIPDSLQENARTLKQQGKTVVFVGTETQILGLLALSDIIRPEAVQALDGLKALRTKTVMLTGDDAATAQVVAAQVGVEAVEANLMPEDKLKAIGRLKETLGAVAMVGDGVNDAPSLAEAHVGIAMGQGADVALETADVALMKNDLRLVSWAIGLAEKSRALIFQNVVFSVLSKLLALAAVFAGVLPLWLAVLADSGAAVLVTFNGLRILRYKSLS